MRTYIQTVGILAIATSLSFGEDAPAKPDKPKPTPEARFKKLDTNSDGSLSLDEFKASPKAQKDPAKAEEAYKKLDADSKDGVSLDEFKAGSHPDKGPGKKKQGDAPAE